MSERLAQRFVEVCERFGSNATRVSVWSGGDTMAVSGPWALGRRRQYRRMPTNAGAARALALRIEERQGASLRLTNDSTRQAAQALRLYADLIEQPRDDDQIFKIETWDGVQLMEVIARCALLPVALAAFEAAKQHRQSYRLTLRAGCRLIREHGPLTT